MPSSDVLIRPLRPADPGVMADLMAIYEQAIPASERKSGAQVEAMARDRNYRLLGAFLAERLIGFAIVCRFGSDRLALLEYMAVEQAHRSEGIGTKLFLGALGLIDARTPLLVEVESDREPSDDHEQRVMRKRFYRRLGCREIADLAYVMPIGDRPPAMNLLVHNVPGERVGRDTILQWVTSLYVDVYGRSASDPKIAAMTARLPEEVALI